MSQRILLVPTGRDAARFAVGKHGAVGRLGVSLASAVTGAVVLAGGAVVLDQQGPSSSEGLRPPEPAQQTGSAPRAPASPGRAPPEPAAPAPLVIESPSPETDTEIAERARDAAQEIVPDAQLGIEVFDRETGSIVTETASGQQVPCMSVVKLFIALDVFSRMPGGVADPETAQQLRRMLRDSDDDVASGFWTSHGGPAIIKRTAARLGLTGTEAPGDDPGQWGDVRTTPQDLTTTYHYITEQLPPPARALVLDALGHAASTVEGFDQHFGIPEGVDDRPWAVKQGWGTSGSRTIMNSTGTVGPGSRYVVIVMATSAYGSRTSLPRAVTAAVRDLAPSLAE